MVCGDNHLHDYSFVDSSLKSWNTTRVPLDSRYYGPREKYRAVNVIYLINHTVGLCRTLSESTSETTPVTRLSACSCCPLYVQLWCPVVRPPIRTCSNQSPPRAGRGRHNTLGCIVFKAAAADRWERRQTVANCYLSPIPRVSLSGVDRGAGWPHRVPRHYRRK